MFETLLTWFGIIPSSFKMLDGLIAWWKGVGTKKKRPEGSPRTFEFTVEGVTEEGKKEKRKVLYTWKDYGNGRVSSVRVHAYLTDHQGSVFDAKLDEKVHDSIEYKRI